MDYGFVRVAAVVPQVNVADCDYNAKNIIDSAEKACAEGAKFVVFPELSVTGYTCGDLFAQSVLLTKAQECLRLIKEETKELDCVLAVGAPVRVGNALYDCAVVISKGEFLGIVPKTYIQVNERRTFVSGERCTNQVVKIGDEDVLFGTDLMFVQDDVKVAVEID